MASFATERWSPSQVTRDWWFVLALRLESPSCGENVQKLRANDNLCLRPVFSFSVNIKISLNPFNLVRKRVLPAVDKTRH